MKQPPLLYTNPNGQTFWRGSLIPSDIGRNGVGIVKKEGDGQTPSGIFQFWVLLYREDRVKLPKKMYLPCLPITPDLGWCTEADSPLYNQPIQLPFQGEHETLWREDHVYDALICISHNQEPIRRGAGSAIFIHLRGNSGVTDGCLALEPNDFWAIASEIKPHDIWRIDPPGASALGRVA